ncbi:MAG: hypothetical protein WD205_08925 [Rhodothermales bacterium]
MTTVRATNGLLFFLVAVRETARQGRDTFQRILELRRRVEQQVVTLGAKAGNARKLLALLYRQPYVRAASDVAEYLDVTPKTARSLIHDLEALGILRETTGNERNRRYLFSEYFELFTR